MPLRHSPAHHAVSGFITRLKEGIKKDHLSETVLIWQGVWLPLHVTLWYILTSVATLHF